MLRAVGREAGEHLANIIALMEEKRAIGKLIAVDAEKVSHRALVDDIPVCAKLLHELRVIRVGIDGVAVFAELGRVDDLHVVDVDADGEGLLAQRVVPDEHAVVGVVELPKAHHVDAPWKDFPLKPPASLRNPVDRLGDHANHGLAVGADVVGSGWLSAVHHFPFEKFALQVSGDEVDAADIAPIARGISE